MFKKTTLYAMGAAAFLMFGGFSLREGAKFHSEPLRAESGLKVVAECPDEGVAFMTDYSEAMSLAAAENRPVMLFFMADDCKYSRQMLDGAFCDSRVERLADKFVCVAVDMNDADNDDACRSFDVAASPTVQFISAYGVRLQRVAGVQSGEKLAEQMQSALASAAWRAARLGENGRMLR